MAASPEVTRGVLHMEIAYKQQLKTEIEGRPIEYYLESGKDPVAVFGFGIVDITTQDEES